MRGSGRTSWRRSPRAAARALAARVCLLGVALAGNVLAQCRIPAPTLVLWDVRVNVPGGSFGLGLEGVAAVIEPLPGRNDVRVSVTAPLRFTAEYPSSQLRLVMAEALDVAGGRLRLGKGMMPLVFGPRGSALRVSPQAALGVEVSAPLEVPCQKLALLDAAAYVPGTRLQSPTLEARGTGVGAVPLYIRPDEKDPLYVRYVGPFAVRERLPGWVLLEASWSDGSKLRGWTPESNTSANVGALPEWGEALNATRRCAWHHRPALTPLSLRKGAALAVSPNGFVWASAAKELRVELDLDHLVDGWVNVAAISTLRNADACTALAQTWVHKSDVLGGLPER